MARRKSTLLSTIPSSVISAAAASWRAARPGDAMVLLAEAGGDRAVREAFLREVIGLSETYIPDYVGDLYVEAVRGW